MTAANGTDGSAGPQGDESGRRPRIVARYTYRDEAGEPLFQVRRWEPGRGGRSKSFTQHARAGDGWAKNLDGARLVLYRLPEVIAAVQSGEVVHVCEGEKDVHTLVRAGRVATCNPGGAGKWRPDFTDALRGGHVRIVVDWDEPGRRHALDVHDAVVGVAASVELVRAVTGCKDVSDHVAAGHALDELRPVTAAELRWQVAVDAAAKGDQTGPVGPGAAQRGDGAPLVLHTLVGLLAGRGPVVPPGAPGGDWGVCCPVHDDKHPSATLRAGEDRPVVFRCHAGCSQEQFFEWCRSQGVTTGDLLDWNRPLAADGSSWSPVDLGGIVSGEVRPELPTIGQRDDRASLFYAGKVHSAAGEPETAKSLLLQFVAVQEVRAGHHVVYVDYEDTAHGVVGRLRDLELTDDEILDRFHYLRPDEPFAAGVQQVVALVEQCRPTLIVLDGVTEAMSVEGGSPLDVADVAAFLRNVARKLADLSGAAVVLIDHVTKSSESRGRWAFGSQHKLAGLDGVAYVAEVVTPFVRGQGGRSKLMISKDRPGWVKPMSAGGKVAGYLNMAPHPSEPGRMFTNIEAPSEADHLAAESEPGSGLEDALLDVLADQPFTLTKTEVQERVGGSKGKFATVWGQLTSNGVMVSQEGDRVGADGKHRTVKVWGLA